MRLPARIRRLFRLGTTRPDVEREVDDELDFHMDQVVRAMIVQGMEEDEAHRAAAARFGNVAAYRSALYEIDRGRVRKMKRRGRLDSIRTTLAVALRRLRRSPAFTLNVIAILGLGIGANAVMFGVIDRLLLSPPQHIEDADRVRLIYLSRTFSNGNHSIDQFLTFPDYLDLEDVDGFSDVAAYANKGRLVMGRGEGAERVQVMSASASLFDVLRVSPRLGRFFVAEEDAVGAAPLAVLAEEFWKRRFGGSNGVIGQTLDIGNGLYEVVGVAPAGFTGAQLGPVDVWLPIETAEGIESGGGEWKNQRGNWWLRTVARLAPGVTDASASAEATTHHRSGRADLTREGQYSTDAVISTESVIAARGPNPTRESSVARWLAGVSLIVLLIACFNVANLLLARAARIKRETALRLALGAGRPRLIAELLAEAFALAGVGASAALVVAWGLGDLLHQTLLPGVAFTDTGLSVRLFTFTAFAAVSAALVAGLPPALQATRAQLADTLKSGGRGVGIGRSRTRIVLLVGQAALSVVLLVGAGLFVQSLNSAETVDLGFDADRIAVVQLQWNETLSGAERTEIYKTAMNRVRRLPQVTEAGLTYTIPFWSSISIGRPRVPGLDSIPRHRSGGPYANKVGAGYFEAMGLEIVRGRPFETRDDREGAEPVLVVTESMAAAVWPNQDPIGRCMILGDPSEDEESFCTQVIGVVENHRRQELVEDDPHYLYFLNDGHPAFRGPPQAIMARISGPVSDQLPLLSREARAVSGQIRFVAVRSLQELIDPQLRSWKLGASMFTLFGVLALVVACWGLYSVLAFDVALRRLELGVRSALGAGTNRLVGLVLRRALLMTCAGTALGLLVAILASPLVEPMLFRVSATDPTTYLGVASMLLLAAGVAGSVPAWRASRVNPTEALQTD